MTMGQREPRVAIVTDPLVQRGGAERCAEVLAGIFPQAPIFAILYSPTTGPASLAARVTTSPLGRIPGGARRHRWLLPFYPAAVESFDLSGYEVIISLHHSAAKGLLRGADQYHICYCCTPMRALWERRSEVGAHLPILARPLAAALLRRQRIWDYVTAARVDRFVAISQTARRRIAKHYGRESEVLYPPIDVVRFSPGRSSRDGDYYLVASRLVPYKRIDLAVAATAALGRKLVIVGRGPEAHLVRAPHVTYLGHVHDEELVDLMRGARAMIFPADDDFGMAPVEMMACGKPVVALAAGGALETVVDGVTGVFANAQTVEAFVRAISALEQRRFDPERIRAHAERFSRESFARAFRRLVDEAPPPPAVRSLNGAPSAMPT